MNCFDAQNLSMQYVNGELSNEKLEGFLRHVCNCEDCKEELEICFTIVNGMKELEGEKIHTSNFKQAFEDMLSNSLKAVEKKSKEFIRKLIIVDFILFLPMFFLMSDSNKTSDTVTYIYSNVSVSDYRMKNIFLFDDTGFRTLELYVDVNEDDIRLKLNEAKQKD